MATKSASAWLTYAWEDNKNRDVDFTAQELKGAGIEVKLDQWTIGAGRRLWDQIERFIQDPKSSDAWILYATQNSLGSEACREEFSYALDRALHTRGSTFPVIGLFPASVDQSLIPAGIRTRLYVSLTDPDWKERIAAAVQGRDPRIAASHVEPYEVNVHRLTPPSKAGARFAIEMRPRAGTWSPFVFAVPIAEREQLVSIYHGPRGKVPGSSMLRTSPPRLSDDQKWWLHVVTNEATPTQSYFAFVKELPTSIVFGAFDGPQYELDVLSSGQSK